MQVYKAGALTAEKLKGAEVSWRDVFDEIPISISNRWAVLAGQLLPMTSACSVRVQLVFQEQLVMHEFRRRVRVLKAVHLEYITILHLLEAFCRACTCTREVALITELPYMR